MSVLTELQSLWASVHGKKLSLEDAPEDYRGPVYARSNDGRPQLLLADGQPIVFPEPSGEAKVHAPC